MMMTTEAAAELSAPNSLAEDSWTLRRLPSYRRLWCLRLSSLCACLWLSSIRASLRPSIRLSSLLLPLLAAPVMPAPTRKGRRK